MNATPSSSRSTAPSPRSASERSGRGIDGWCSAVGWNCTNSRSAHATPAFSASAMPSPVESVGFVVTAKHWPDAAGREHDVGGPHELDLAVGPQREHAGAAAAARRAARSRTSPRAPRSVAALDRGDERPLDLGAGRVAARVHDARERVAALAREQQLAPSAPCSVSNCAPSAASSRTRSGPSVTSTRTASTSHSPRRPRACRRGAARASRARPARRRRHPARSASPSATARPWSARAPTGPARAAWSAVVRPATPLPSTRTSVTSQEPTASRGSAVIRSRAPRDRP